MDVNDLRVGVTLLSMVVFLGIAAWAYSKRNKQSFDELAALPLMDDGPADANASQGARNE